MKIKTFLKIGLVIGLICLSSYCIYYNFMDARVDVDKNIEHLRLDKIEKLMIVAHPDDDILWGGSHLIDDAYLVVCITCGERRRRVLEFKKAMGKTEDAYLMLGYPDKTNGKKDDWSTSYEKIYQDLKKIIQYKDWQVVVTHNPNGEYGHIHHKMTNSIVTDIANHDQLYYFGKYYSKEQLPTGMQQISEENYKKKKEEIIPVYVSQKKVTKGFEHMLPYENWVRYNDWYHEK